MMILMWAHSHKNIDKSFRLFLFIWSTYTSVIWPVIFNSENKIRLLNVTGLANIEM